MKLAFVCPIAFDALEGSGAVRHCGACDRQVHDVTDCGEAALRVKEPGFCGRWLALADGTLTTRPLLVSALASALAACVPPGSAGLEARIDTGPGTDTLHTGDTFGADDARGTPTSADRALAAEVVRRTREELGRLELPGVQAADPDGPAKVRAHGQPVRDRAILGTALRASRVRHGRPAALMEALDAELFGAVDLDVGLSWVGGATAEVVRLPAPVAALARTRGPSPEDDR